MTMSATIYIWHNDYVHVNHHVIYGNVGLYLWQKYYANVNHHVIYGNVCYMTMAMVCLPWDCVWLESDGTNYIFGRTSPTSDTLHLWGNWSVMEEKKQCLSILNLLFYHHMGCLKAKKKYSLSLLYSQTVSFAQVS